MSPNADEKQRPKPDVLKAYPRTQEEVDLIDQAKEKDYTTRSAFLMKAAVEKAKEVLEHDE